MDIKQLNEELEKILQQSSIQEKLEKIVIKDFIRLAKEYYGQDYIKSLKENNDKVVWDEQPRGYFTINFKIFGDEQMLLSTPIDEVEQDFIIDIVRRINSAIEYEEIDKLLSYYNLY